MPAARDPQKRKAKRVADVKGRAEFDPARKVARAQAESRDVKARVEFDPARRVARVRAEVKDTKGAKERRRGDAVKQTAAYLKNLRVARTRLDDRRSGLKYGIDFKASREETTRDNDAEYLLRKNPEHVDRPRSDKEYRDFLKSGARPVREARGTGFRGSSGGVASTGLKQLEQSLRPLHASAATSKALVEGRGPGKALSEGGKAFKKNKGPLYSDVLKSAGVKNKTVAAVAGFALDMVADPTMGARLSRLSPQRQLEREAGRVEVQANKARTKSRDAADAGKGAKANRLAKRSVEASKRAEKLREQAQKANTHKGIQLRYEAKVPFGPRVSVGTRGKATAKVAEKGGGRVAERIQQSAPVQAVGHAASATFRGKGVSQAEHEAIVYAKRQKRAKEAMASRVAGRRGTAHARAAKKVDVPVMIRAVEGAAKVPAAETRVVRRISDERRAVSKAKRVVRTAERREIRERTLAEVKAREGSRVTLAAALKQGSKSKHPAAKAAVTQFKIARNQRVTASQELSKARKASRNANTGARSLYSDAERAAVAERLKNAQAATNLSVAQLKAAEAHLLEVATRETSKKARRVDSSKVANLDRMPPKQLARLEKARGDVAAAKAELAGAKKRAAGAPPQVRVRMVGDQSYREWRAAQPKYTVDELDTTAKPLAEATKREFADILGRQRAAGVQVGDVGDDYYTHTLKDETRSKSLKKRAARLIESGKGGSGRPAKGGSSAQHRKDERPMFEQDAERAAAGKEPLFSTDHGSVVAKRLAEGERSIADAQYLAELKKIGKPLTELSYARRRDTDGVYAMGPAKTPRELSEAEASALVRGESHVFVDGERKKILDKGEDAVVFPRFEMNREITGRGSQKFADPARGFVKTLNKPQQWWKSVVTTMNIPAYQERNFYDDTFRFWMGDGAALDIPRSIGLLKDQALWERRLETQLNPTPIEGNVVVAGERRSRADFLKQAEEDGIIRTGFYSGDDLLEESIKPKTGLQRVRPVQKVRQYSQNVEDVPRLASYKSALDRGLTRAEAAQHTRLYHFDYSELTDVERALRLAIPFWTFTKKNTVLQTQMIVSKPGKAGAFAKARAEGNAYSTDSDDYRADVKELGPLLNEAMSAGVYSKQDVSGLRGGKFDPFLTEPDQRAYPTLGPDGNLYYSPLSLGDLNRLPFVGSWNEFQKLPKQQWDLALSMLGPMPKLPIEHMENYSYFFKEAIYATPDEPNAPDLVPAPSWAKKLGLVKGQVSKNGKMVDGWPAQIDYFVRAMGPQAGLATTLATPVRNPRGQTGKDHLVRQLTGLRRADFNDRIMAGMIERTVQAKGEVQFEMNKLKKRYKNGLPLRTEDGYFNTKRYQALANREKKLTTLFESLTLKRTGFKRPATRISARPLSLEQQTVKDLKKLEESLDPEAEYRAFEAEMARREAASRLSP